MQNRQQLFAEFMWRLVSVSHLALILFHTLAFFILAIYGMTGKIEWYIALPCCSWIYYTAFSTVPCPLTTLENSYRQKCGRRQIRGWIGHYFLKLPKQIFGLMPKDELYVTDKVGVPDSISTAGRR